MSEPLSTSQPEPSAERPRLDPGWSLATLAVHSGQLEPAGGQPLAVPIYHAAAFVYDSADELDAAFAGERRGYVYSRYANPTVAALEQAVAVLEGAEEAVAFSSGMAAIHAALLATGLKAGDCVLASQDCYGMTRTLLEGLFSTLGVRVRFIDLLDRAGMVAAVEAERPRALLVETISNPLLRIADLPEVAAIARAAGAALLVDATFTPPPILRALEHGADLVIHSATKYFGGHDDVTGGVVAGSAERAAELRALVKLVGGVLSPAEAFLTLRGIKTLPLRVERQCQSAAAVAEWLEGHPRIARVYYPGLASHPQHALARRLLSSGLFGAMVAFDLREADRGAVFAFMDRLRLVRPAPTLGDVYSLLLYPAMASHRGLAPEQRRALGIGDGLVRLSVGIEDPADIVADLARALGA